MTEKRSTGAGRLFVVATPLGNLGDISARAVEVLAAVNAIAAEDTRHSQNLLRHLGVDTRLFPLHEHNEGTMLDPVLKRLSQGEDIALISDAGTPLISDPGYQLIRAARAQGLAVVPIPGPCALVAALSCAGLPSDRFVFEGFPPIKSAARVKYLQSLAQDPRTLIFYEAPHRILASLRDMAAAFGPDREAVVARELTKTFETVLGGSLDDLLRQVGEDSNQQRGEFVILVHGHEKRPEEDLTPATLHVLDTLMAELPLKQAAALTAKITGVKKNLLYQAALQRK